MEQDQTSRPEVTVNINTPVVVAASVVTLIFMRVTSVRLLTIIRNQHQLNDHILELRQDALSTREVINVIAPPKGTE